jgi:thiol-disulfide isomerase/thioredoxin
MRGRLHAVALAVAAGICSIAAAVPCAQQPLTSDGVGESRLPAFTVKDLRGQTLSSADFQGKVMLVDFWATWCEPCKKEMPGYQRLADKYAKQGLVVIGFKMNDMPDTESPLHFARRMKVRYPLIVATDELIQAFGGIDGLPTTLLYDRNGKLVKKVIGFEYAKEFESALKNLL